MAGVSQWAGIFIAAVSLFLSIYAINRDRGNKKIERLLSSRQRLLSIGESADVLTPDEMQEYFEDDPHSYEAEKQRALSRDISQKRDGEFEFLCYMVERRQVPFTMFFDLFRNWLHFRLKAWPMTQKHKIHNNPYTWSVIQECCRKGMLPFHGQSHEEKSTPSV